MDSPHRTNRSIPTSSAAAAGDTPSYVYRVDPADATGNSNAGCAEASLQGLAAVFDKPAGILSYPNPFATQLKVRVDVPAQSGGTAQVKVSVYDAGRRLVTTLLDGTRGAGSYLLQWDGRNGSGQPVTPGVYLVVYELNGQKVKAEWLARKWAP